MPAIGREELVARARNLLETLGVGRMSATAYDTAWVARIPGPRADRAPLYPSAFDWLLRHQNADGSWGANVVHAHDRVISTLAAVVTLRQTVYRQAESEPAVRRGIVYLNTNRPSVVDENSETVGFELILPELVRDCQALGLRLPYQDWAFVDALQHDKLRRIPPIALYGGPTSLTFSLEYLGDRLIPTLIDRCQGPSGSYAASPSATAYVQLRAPNALAAGYLERVVTTGPDGGAVDAYPIDVFELAWSLQSLNSLLGISEYQAAVAKLQGFWKPTGVGYTGTGMVPDADETSMAIAVLQDAGQSVGTAALEQFEGPEFFYCFPFERNQSVRANAGVIEALRLYPSDQN